MPAMTEPKPKQAGDIRERRYAAPARFARLRAEVYALLERDPAAAFARVDAPENSAFGEPTLQGLRACLYVDGGTHHRNKALVARGIEIFEQLVDEYPNEANFKYCLANGLATLADLQPYEDRGWYLKTASGRQRAKNLYHHCTQADVDRDLKARAHTNLGNALLKAFRFVEAYDCYSRALGFDPTNTVAAAGAARVLLSYAASGIGDRETLLAAANEHLRYARSNPERFRELAGERAVTEFAPLLQYSFPEVQRPDLSKATAYQRFVRDHRLALSPTIEGLDLSLKRWDSLRLPGILAAPGSHYQVPTVFATFNVLKAEYLAVRHLAFVAMYKPPPESGSYADTLDYACYGVTPACLSLAQRTCVDVLDKLAVALLHYLGETKSERNLSFLNAFFERDSEARDWKPLVRQEIDCHNRGVLAIAEMAADVAHQGYLRSKRQLRNAGTHRFVILHDISLATASEVEIIERYDADEFRDHLIESLQLVRAALIYFVEAVADREKRTTVEHVVTMDVPDHDRIRGRR